MAAICAVTLAAGTNRASAHDFAHDDHGYWDDHHRYHHYEYNNSHRGYWDQRNGARVFISL